MDQKSVEQIIKLTRRRAKFVHVSHSDDFIEEKIPGIKRFFYVNLYDEKIDSNVLKIRDKLILVHNTYLSSFAYNLGLCWLYDQLPLTASQEPKVAIEKLIKHNYKKLFAEQLYHYRNSIFSRSILLETLLYEQDMMVKVFAEKEKNKDLDSTARFLSALFSDLLSNHELAHIYLEPAEVSWQDAFAGESLWVINFIKALEEKYPKLFVEEVICDIISILSCINQYKNTHHLGLILNGVIWGFASYATIYSLVKSAKYTADKHAGIKEEVDLSSIQHIKRDYDYFIGEDKDFIERASLMLHFCERIAENEECEIYENHPDFSIPQHILTYSLAYLDQVMVNEDNNSRNISMLIAESFFKHEAGIEYLYLRSKSFQSERENLKPQ